MTKLVGLASSEARVARALGPADDRALPMPANNADDPVGSCGTLQRTPFNRSLPGSAVPLMYRHRLN